MKMATLSTPVGDGSLRVAVDEFGTFGSTSFNGSNAFYDPIGELGEAGTVFYSGVAIGFGDETSRAFLTPFLSGYSDRFTQETPTNADSLFQVRDLSFALNQQVSELRVGDARGGSSLIQTYSITNVGSSPVSFDLVRYMDGDLQFDGSRSDAGGQLVRDGQEILFETDSGDNPLFATTFVGITATGGSIELPGRFEVDGYSVLSSQITGGAVLDDTIAGDSEDADRFIDSAPYDVAIALDNRFVLNPGESTTYTTTTIFGSGAPQDVVLNPEEPQPPPVEPPTPVDPTIPDNLPNSIATARNLSFLRGSQSISDFIGGLDANDYLRFDLTQDSTLNLALTGAIADADLALLDSQGRQISTVRAGNGSDGLLDVNLEAGNYYLRVFRFDAASTPYTLNLTATPEPPPFQVRDIYPYTGSSAGQTTVTVYGDRFTPDTQVSLVDDAGNARPATNVTWLDDRRLSATLDLQGLSVDSYDILATDAAGTDTAEDAFSVNVGSVGQVEIYLNAPQRVRPFGSQFVTVSYRNVGETDAVAPLLNLEVEGAQLQLPESEEFTESQIQFLGINDEGLAGILPPGAYSSFTVAFEPTAQIGQTINFKVNAADGTAPIDWNAFKDQARPSSVPVEAWDGIYSNFLTEAGNTAADYQALLVENANTLSQQGEYVGDANRLLALEFQQSGNSDALSGRYSLGSFGRGIPFIGDIRAITDAEGNVSIENGGTQRQFERQADGTFLAESEDSATLTRDGEVLRLREIDGAVVTFLANGRIGSIADTNGNTVTANYTGDRLTSLGVSNGDSIAFTYNDQNRITSTTDNTGRTTTYTYDPTGELLLSTTDPSGTTSYTYNDQFALTSITDSSGTQAVLEYDDRGRVIRESFGDGSEAITYTYGEEGEVTVTDATGATTELMLNDSGQVTQVEDALGRRLQIRYDDRGSPTRIIAPGNTNTGFTYDDDGNLLSQVNALGQRTQFAYEPSFNQLSQVTDARGNELNYSYDDRGNLSSITYDDGSIESFSYDSQGNVIGYTNRRGESIAYTYDTSGQLLRQDNPDGSFQAYTYDSRGNTTSTTDSRGTLALEYDSADRLTKITYPTGRSLAYTYDAANRRTRMVDGEGNAVNYTYDAAGRLASLTDGAGNPIVAYTYDTVGRLTREQNGNGTTTTYSYDTAGQLTSIVNLATDSSVNSRFDYTYDELGRQVGTNTLDGNWTYTYDDIGQLTGAVFASTNPEIPNQDLTYVYDAAGNRIRTVENGVTANYGTNNLNQYTTAGEFSYTYDADGNLISKVRGSETWTYGYNNENQLVRVVETDGTTTEYEYDTFGNRTATIDNGQRTEYLVDPFDFKDVVAEYDGSGNLIARYANGLGLVSRTDTVNTAYYDFNAVGSTVGLTGGTGTYLNRYTYRPFGEEIAETETVANPFEFVGQWGVMEEGNGLDFMRARFYDSLTGKFTSTDPIGIEGGINLYNYVQSNPISYADPSGEIAWFAAPFIGALIGGGIDLGIQLYRNGGRLECVDWIDVGISSGLGAVFGSTGPSGILFGRGGTKAAQLGYKGGIFNQGNRRAGWSFNQGKNWFSIHGGKPRTDGHWHRDLFSFPGAADPRVGTTGVIGGTTGGLFPNGNDSHNCESDEQIPSPDIPTKPVNESSTNVVASLDPNDIIGPAGFGTEGWLATPQLLPYTIRFENIGDIAAVLVNITHPLDSDVDLDTFELGDFGFGNLIVDVPDGFQNYSDRLDLRNTIGAFVDFEANLDPATRTVTWTLTTIDPETGELATGVEDGFLPPNVNGSGEGFVNYSVEPNPNLPTGTAIEAQASIVFDTNEPIVTPLVVNTADIGSPSSTITDLPATTDGAEFPVSWEGTDDGSGIRSYDIYVSADGQPFTLWLDDTPETSATYPGEIGTTYAFYSQATDNVGHIELAEATAQATTIAAATNSDSLTRGKTLLGTSEKDFLVGTRGNDVLDGDGNEDILAAGAGNDRLFGGEDDDLLFGDYGNDFLVGVAAETPNPGGDEVDILIGGRGADVFVLGDATQSYYEDVLGESGLDDFALIRDFVPTEDTIQIHGNSRDYQLDRNPSGLPDGTAIFYRQTDLISIIEGDASFTLGDRSFRFR
jgi:RHS repeat-associated protein